MGKGGFVLATTCTLSWKGKYSLPSQRGTWANEQGYCHGTVPLFVIVQHGQAAAFLCGWTRRKEGRAFALQEDGGPWTSWERGSDNSLVVTGGLVSVGWWPFKSLSHSDGFPGPRWAPGAWGSSAGPPICMQFREVSCLKAEILAALGALAFSGKRPKRRAVKTEVSCWNYLSWESLGSQEGLEAGKGEMREGQLPTTGAWGTCRKNWGLRCTGKE